MPASGRRVGHVFLELTNACNFNCAFCPNEIMTRKRGFMTTALARQIIDEIADTSLSDSLVFHLMGEPFLHPDWFGIFGHAAARNLRVTFGTNGSLLSGERLRELFSLPIELMLLSLQTPTRETFELRRAKSLGFDEYVEIIRKIIRKKFETGNAVRLQMDLLNTCSFVRRLTDLNDSIRALETDEDARSVVLEWMEYASLLVKDLGIRHRLPTQQDVKAISLRKGFSFEILPKVVLASRRATTWGNSLTNRKRIIPGTVGGCDALEGQFGILWDGSLVLCCADFDGRTVLGNVRHSGIGDILESSRARRIHRGFRVGRLVHPYCRLCRGGTTLQVALVRQVGTLIRDRLRISRFIHA